MNDVKLIVTRGLPGAGKTDFINRHFSKDRFNIISSDELRKQITALNYKEGKPENLGFKNTLIYLIRESLSQNRNTVLNATNCHPRDLNNFLKISKEYGANFLILDFSYMSLEECKRRLRTYSEEQQVPDEVMEDKYKALKNPLSKTLQDYVLKVNEITF